MKKILQFLILSTFLYCSEAAFASAGFYENPGATQYVSIVVNQGSGNVYHRVSQWSSFDFGTITSSSTFTLDGGLAHVYKDNSSDITAVSVKYRVYKQGSTAPSYNSFTVAFSANLGGNNQRWEEVGKGVDLKNGVNSLGTWVLDIYFEAATNAVNCSNPELWGSSGTPYSATFTASTGLPVSLVDFSAFLNPQNQTELSWSTASELNASHFNVHRSENGIEKQAIGVISAQGNSNEVVEYNFVDVQPVNGQAFYFLEQVDFDGKTEWFGPVKVSNAVNNQADAVFGVNNDIVITLNGSIEMDRLEAKLFNMQGQLIKSTEFLGDQMSRELSVKVTDLPSGIYMLYLQSDNMEQAIKLIK